MSVKPRMPRKPRTREKHAPTSNDANSLREAAPRIRHLGPGVISLTAPAGRVVSNLPGTLPIKSLTIETHYRLIPPGSPYEFCDEDRSMRYRGEHFTFGKKQRKAIKVMHDAYEHGKSEGLPERWILAQAGLKGSRLYDIFRNSTSSGRRKAWGTLIVRTKRGWYRLNLP